VVCDGSHSDHIQRVYVVGPDGKLLASYGGVRGSAVGHLNFPRHLAVLGDRGVLVAEFINQRVILLNSALGFVGEVSDRRLDFCPYRLCVDVRHRRLYVGGHIRGSELGTLAVFDI